MGPGFSYEQKINPVLLEYTYLSLWFSELPPKIQVHCVLYQSTPSCFMDFFFNVGGRKKLLINLMLNALFMCVYSHDGSVSCIFGTALS